MVLIRFVVQRIDNTADFGTSGLDERQAAGLLSAVGDTGLSLVEPGPISDPVAAGLKAAMHRCRNLWERSQPQLTIDGWADMLAGLDAADAGAVRCVEPAHTTRAGSGGLAVGDGERPESPSGPTRPLYNINGHDALPSESARRGRKEATP